VTKREIDPFSCEGADELMGKRYEVTSGLQAIYACFFEFSLYTGTRPDEATTLRSSEVDTRSRRAKVCRIRLYGKMKERTKTKV
jgi:integrase